MMSFLAVILSAVSLIAPSAMALPCAKETGPLTLEICPIGTDGYTAEAARARNFRKISTGTASGSSVASATATIAALQASTGTLLSTKASTGTCPSGYAVSAVWASSVTCSVVSSEVSSNTITGVLPLAKGGLANTIGQAQSVVSGGVDFSTIPVPSTATVVYNTQGNLAAPYGITAATGVFSSTLTVQGNAFSVGGAKIVGDSANSFTVPTATFTFKNSVEVNGASFLMNAVPNSGVIESGIINPFAGARWVLWDNANKKYGYEWYNDPVATTLCMITHNNSTAGTPAMCFGRASTSIGIGTASPATKLHISSGTLTIDGTGAALRLIGNATTITASTITASVMVATATNNYSILSSSGINMAAGTLNLGTGALCFGANGCQTAPPGSGTIGGSGTAGNIPYLSAATTLADSPLKTDGTNIISTNTWTAPQTAANGFYVGTSTEAVGVWYNWTPKVAGWSGSPTITARYTKLGKTVCFSVRVDGTSNATNNSIYLPYILGATNNFFYAANCYDGGTAMALPCSLQCLTNGSACALYKQFDGSGTGFTNPGNTIVNASGCYESQ